MNFKYLLLASLLLLSTLSFGLEVETEPSSNIEEGGAGEVPADAVKHDLRGTSTGSYILTTEVYYGTIPTPPAPLSGEYLTFYPTFHDFVFSANGAHFKNGSNPDFQRNQPGFPNLPDPGIVSDTLGGDGLPVYIGGTTNSTYSQASFDQWYRDGFVLTGYALYLTLNASNIYSYASTPEAFFPLDGYGFGNQGQDAGGNPHNFCFTMFFSGTFTYTSNEFFTVTSDDDTWLFINNKLVIDQGGIHNPTSTTVYLGAQEAALGLVVGQPFSFSLFYAERHTPGADFEFATNVGVPVSTTTTSSSTTTTTTGTGKGGFQQDPIFNGLQGETYQITGSDHTWFNILSAPSIQFNGFFADTCKGKPSTVISAIAIDVNGHKIAMNATGDLMLDGVAIGSDQGWKGTPIGLNGKYGNLARPWVNYVYLYTPDFAITIIRHVVDFTIQKDGMDFSGHDCLAAYFNSKVQLNNKNLRPHGLLGQTAHHAHPHHVSHVGPQGQGQGEIEGTYRDYIVSGAYATDFKFNKYTFTA